jgi:plasmid stabilization system protein ParE
VTRIVWTEPAVADLSAIVEFIARDSAVYASAMADRFLAAVEQLATFPRSGRLVPEDRGRSVREVIVARYRVLYRLRRSRVEVLAVIHGAREMKRMSRRPWDRD